VLYLDTSALIKQYVREPGTERISARLQEEFVTGRSVFTSVLAFAEVHAALVQRRNDKSLSNRTFLLCRRNFETDWQSSFSVVALDSSVLLIVREVVELNLKGADAVHLASAVWLRDSVALGALPDVNAGSVTFATSDKKLAKAALTKKLSVFIPEDHP